MEEVYSCETSVFFFAKLHGIMFQKTIILKATYIYHVPKTNTPLFILFRIWDCLKYMNILWY
jgi:hypothetical protein